LLLRNAPARRSSLRGRRIGGLCGQRSANETKKEIDMKYLVAALAALFVVAAPAPPAHAAGATCVGGVYNSACVAGAYDVVVVRRPRAVVVRPRCVWVRGRCV
jgi:hypothetical protein